MVWVLNSDDFLKRQCPYNAVSIIKKYQEMTPHISRLKERYGVSCCWFSIWLIFCLSYYSGPRIGSGNGLSPVRHQAITWTRYNNILLYFTFCKRLILLGLLSWCPMFKLSRCHSLEDPKNVDFIYGCRTFKWRSGTGQYDRVSGYNSPCYCCCWTCPIPVRLTFCKSGQDASTNNVQ